MRSTSRTCTRVSKEKRVVMRVSSGQRYNNNPIDGDCSEEPLQYVPIWGNDSEDMFEMKSDESDTGIEHAVMTSAAQTARELAESFDLPHSGRRDEEKEPLIKSISDDAEALVAIRERMRTLYGQQDENDAMGYEGGSSSSSNETDLAYSDCAMEDHCDIKSMQTENTTLYNHPALIRELPARRQQEIKIDKLSVVISPTSLPPVPKRRRVNFNNVTMHSAVSSTRPEDETVAGKHARKRSEKEKRRERRQENKSNKMAFCVESIQQQKQTLAIGACQRRIV